MKIINSGFAYALASMVLMGISTFLYKRSTDAIGATNTTFFYYLFSIIIATAAWVIFRERQAFPTSALIWPLIIAICLFSSVWLFTLSLSHIQVSTASTIRALFFVVTVALAIIFTQERPGPLGIAGIGLAVSAVILIGLDQRSG